MKKIIKELIPYILILIGVVLIRTFIITPIMVDGESMNPTLQNREILILNKFDKTFEYNDIIVLNYKNERLIKRIIAKPGDYIEYKNHKLYINGKLKKDKFAKDTKEFCLEYFDIKKIPKDQYFVLGDNRNNSIDSRIIGLISKDDIMGTVTFGIFPFGNIKK